MQIKRYVAADMRRALQLVKDNLGDDAVILSNRKTEEGVEILATLEYEPQQPEDRNPGFVEQPVTDDFTPLSSDFDFEQQRAAVRAAADQLRRSPAAAQKASPLAGSSLPVSAQKDEGFVGLSETAKLRLEKEVEAARERMLNARRQEAGISNQPSYAEQVEAEHEQRAMANQFKQDTAYQEQAASPIGASMDSRSVKNDLAQVEKDAENARIESLHSEIQDLRKMLQERMTEPAEPQVVATNRYHTPMQKTVMSRLSTLGLPEESAVELLRNIDGSLSVSEAWPQVLAEFSRTVDCNQADPVANGGVYALVGPTGVGKTTTIAKLATRYVLEHGPEEVALVTTDNYRIAAHEQLKAVGRILEIPVRVVDERRSLDEVLHNLRKRSLVLIDTAGMRQGDPELRAQMNMLRSQPDVKTLLVLNSSSQFQVMRSAVHSYGEAQLSGCVISKLDEAVSMGEVLGVVMESRLPVYYTTDGQEVPQDIQIARGHQLVTRAVKLASGGQQQSSAVNLAAG